MQTKPTKKFYVQSFSHCRRSEGRDREVTGSAFIVWYQQLDTRKVYELILKPQQNCSLFESGRFIIHPIYLFGLLLLRISSKKPL